MGTVYRYRVTGERDPFVGSACPGGLTMGRGNVGSARVPWQFECGWQVGVGGDDSAGGAGHADNMPWQCGCM